MKTIYISHSHKMNYEEELYRPLLNSNISNLYNLVFPHSSEYDKVNVIKSNPKRNAYKITCVDGKIIEEKL